MNTEGLQAFVSSIVSGTISGLVVAYIQHIMTRPSPPSGSWKSLNRWVIPIAIAVVCGLGTYFFLRRSGPSIAISTPNDRAQVAAVISVRGTYQRITRNTDIWVCVVTESPRRYTVFRAVKYQDGTWEAKEVAVGAADDDGVTFTIGVFAADQQQASPILEKDPIDRISLPNGTFVFDERVVNRAER